jgi:hypothetical protein
MERLERFAEQTLPAFTDLNKAAPGINEAFTHLPAFSKSSEKFFINLGKTAKRSGPALVSSKKLLGELKLLGAGAKPFTANLAQLFTSLRDTGGLERIMDFIFLGAGAANGYDQLGHFLRTEGVGTICVKYAIAPVSGCNAHLGTTSPPKASKASKASIPPGTGLEMERTLAVINGATPAQAIAKYPGDPHAEASTPTVAGGGGAATSRPVGGSTAGTTYYSPSSEGSEADGMLLNFLLGN